MATKDKKKFDHRVKTPVLLQMEAVECGAASLAIILAYYKKYISLEELRIECQVTRDGVNALNILEAAKKYSLHGEGYSVENVEDLFEIKFPAIIFWDFNHFLVVEGYKKGKFYINDPASGPRTVSEKEFKQRFTGVLLTFEPTDQFKIGGKKTNLLSYIGHWLKGSYSAVAFFVITGLFLVFPGLIIPIFSKIFIDDILIKRMNNWIFPLIIGMVFTAILRGILVLLQKYYLLRFEEKLAISSSARLFWHILKLPVRFFTQRYAGEIGTRIAINNSIARFVAGNLAETVLNLIMIVFFASLMFYYDVFMTLMGIFIAIVNIVLLYYISQKIKNQKLKLLQEDGKLFGFTISGFQIIESLKAGGNELDFFLKYSSHYAKTATEDQKLNFMINVLIVTPTLLFSINTALILFIGSLRVMDGALTMGMLVAFQSLMSSFIMPVTSLVQLGGTLQEMNGNAKRIEDVLIHPEDPQVEKLVNHNMMDVEKLSGKVEIIDISFGYGSKEDPLIKKFSAKLGQGARIAIVGKSGSGKSTIGKLVAGLYQPWEGEILFDSSTRDEFPRVVLNNSIAVVDQNISMFEGTIKENISLWDETLPDDDIIQACKDACIHDEIVQRHLSYEHKIEEGGRNFSGGEKQRIEIARALAVNPSILILDEATSALDSVIEKEIMENIKRRNCTCLIIAHRLSTIKGCDEIIVLKNGAIVERGSHQKLVKSGGYYSRLINE